MATLRSKVSRAFLYTAPTSKTNLGTHVIEEMGLHPLVFPTPSPTILVMTAANNDLIAKTAAAVSGDTELIRLRDESEAAWNIVFSSEADYVDGIAKGNAVITVQSGFDSTKTETTEHPAPGFVGVKKIITNVGQPGTVLFDCSHAEFALGHVYVGVQGQGPEMTMVNNTLVLTTPMGPMGSSKIVIGISTHVKYVLGTFPSGTPIGCVLWVSMLRALGLLPVGCR
jgi:hypothetical protein